MFFTAGLLHDIGKLVLASADADGRKLHSSQAPRGALHILDPPSAALLRYGERLVENAEFVEGICRL